MKLVLSLFSFLLLSTLGAQNQFFSFKELKDPTLLNYQGYYEIKEQVDNERTLWEKMTYSFQVNALELKEDTFHVELCYDQAFFKLFGEQIISTDSPVLCIPVKYEMTYQDFSVVKIKEPEMLELSVLAASKLNVLAIDLLKAFQMKAIIQRDVQSLLTSFRTYDEKEAKSYSENFLAKFYELPDLYQGVLSAELLGNFNKQKQLKELHLVYDYREGGLKTRNDGGPKIEINRSSHIAFNTKIAFTEIYQELLGFIFFYSNGKVYDLTQNFMISRTE